MQLIQLHTFFHGEKDAADSIAFFFIHSGGGAWGRSAEAPPRNGKKSMQLNQMHPFLHSKKYAAESAVSFQMFCNIAAE